MGSKKISEFEPVDALTGNDEFLVIDASNVSGPDAFDIGTPSKTTLSNLDQVLVTKVPTPGSIGQKGEKGAPGSVGTPGVVGDDGEIGLQGVLGNRGQDGAKGTTGQTGQRGSHGDMGQPGDEGDLGSPGQRGQPGPTGPKGYASTHVVGARGDKGAKGYRGEVGETGYPGQKGIPGLPVMGPQGLRGDIGKIEIGPKGYKGQPGEVLPIGRMGDVGESGPPCAYSKSPKRTMRLPDGTFHHARYLFEVTKLPKNVYSYEWESDILDQAIGDISLHHRRFLIFQLDDTNFTDFSYSKYFVEVDFEPFITDQHSPVLSKVTLAAYRDGVTYGTVGLDWYKDGDGNHHIMFFSVSSNGNNNPIKIKKTFAHYGSVNVGTENLENFRI